MGNRALGDAAPPCGIDIFDISAAYLTFVSVLLERHGYLALGTGPRGRSARRLGV